MDYYQRPPSKGLGVASLVLGIVSLVFFCSCANIVTAIIAIIMGIVQIARFGKYGRAYALGGIITSVISIILLVVFWVVVSSNTALSDSVIDFSQGDSELPKSFEEYLEEYGNDDMEEYFAPFMDPGLETPEKAPDEFSVDEGSAEEL
ncbi:MAG: DUF4190 domain-containing protein [Lachnospiraceae bacterium]|nr:DUF4190 domain-containing protein [Lachnospiraceae bacterium]